MSKRRKLKSWKSDVVDPSHMVMRMVSVRADTANDENKSVEVVVATENPVERYDMNRGAVVKEILLMDGIEFRTERRQLPIVDSHDRSTVRNILGSVRNLRTEGDELVGDAQFASDEESQVAYQKLRDGHITDFSITATPNEIQFIQRGDSYKLRDQEIKGPAEIVTRWQPTDASLVATGADSRSTVRDSLRRSYEIPRQQDTEEMSPEVKKALVDRGLPEELEETEEILNWVIENMARQSDEEEAERAEESEETEEEEMETAERTEDTAGQIERTEQTVDVDGSVQRALQADRKRQKEIRAICEKVGIERAFADDLCDRGVTLDAARKEVIERMSANGKPLGQSSENVRVTEAAEDKFYAAAHDGLVQRALQAAGSKRPAFGEGQKPAAGHEDFQHIGLRRMSEKFVQRMGGNIDRMAAKDIAMVALGHYPTMQRFGIQRDAYHTTGSFANLMLDAANKTLLAGYEEAPYTWSIWARQAPSTPDFKNINRIRFSESPDLEMVPENHPYKEKTLSDAKEQYKVEKFGAMFSVTWETVVNDDLDAISRVPAMQGTAARRVQNKKVYEILTDNDNLADGGALFNTTAQSAGGTGHANKASTAAAISVSTLNDGFKSMMTIKGLDATTILNIQPSFLLVPAAISATALQVVGSIADPSAGGSAAGNSNTLNIYGPNGSRPLRVVVEPQLDGNSATAWYLAASPSQVDTVELCFLQGEESPVLENEWDFSRDCYKYKIRQTFGVKAIDFRGLYLNDGA